MKKLLATLSLLAMILFLVVPFTMTTSAETINDVLFEGEYSASDFGASSKYPEVIIMYSNGELDGKTEILFDDDDRIIRINKYSYPDGEWFLYQYNTLEYTNDTTITMNIYHLSETGTPSFDGYTVITYSGNLVEKEEQYAFDDEGIANLNITTVWSYNTDGYLTSKKTYQQGSETPSYDYQYVYDTNNTLIERYIIHSYAGAKDYKYTYSYDTEGRLTLQTCAYLIRGDMQDYDYISREMRTTYDSEGVETTFYYKENPSTHVLLEESYSKQEVTYITIGTQDFISQKIVYSPDEITPGEWTTFSTEVYQYDEDGDLISYVSDDAKVEYTYHVVEPDPAPSEDPTPEDDPTPDVTPAPEEQSAPVGLIIAIVIIALIALYVCAYFFLFKKGILKGAFFAKFFLPMDKLVELCTRKK